MKKGLSDKTAIARVVAALESLKIPYMAVGSLSTNSYGMPRSTKDADFVVRLESIAPAQIVKELGDPFRLEGQSHFETITATSFHRIRIKGTSFIIELFELGTDAYDQQRFSRRVQLTTPEGSIWVQSAEDAVITKLRWAARSKRGKDRDDVHDVLVVSGAMLDWDYINRWCDMQGTRSLLEEIRSEIQKRS